MAEKSSNLTEGTKKSQRISSLLNTAVLPQNSNEELTGNNILATRSIVLNVVGMGHRWRDEPTKNYGENYLLHNSSA